jgi:peptide-methionine (R)-S-oxide reductase
VLYFLRNFFYKINIGGTTMKRLMIKYISSILLLMTIPFLVICGENQTQSKKKSETQVSETKKGEEENKMEYKVKKSDSEWKEQLTPEQYKVLRQKATERPFTGKYDDFYEEGVYKCAACGAVLFSSETKYNAGCGWPSFSESTSDDNIAYEEDNSLGKKRTEILCSQCGGHLGHIFDDGPAPTYKRYCVNSASLQFEESKVDSTEDK